MRPCIVILCCGLPASGKSTLMHYLVSGDAPQPKWIYARQCYIFDEHEKSTTMAQGISHFDPSRWKQAQRSFRERILQEIQSLVIASDPQNPEVGVGALNMLLIEDNFALSSMRHQYYQMFRAHESVVGLFILHLHVADDGNPARNVSENHRRNSFRPITQRVPFQVLQRMSQRFEVPPSNKWEHDVTLQICTATSERELCVSLEEYARMLDSFIHDKLCGGQGGTYTTRYAPFNSLKEEALRVTERQKAQTQVRESVPHAVDLALRRHISSRLALRKNSPSSAELCKSEVSSFNKQKVAEEWSQRKRTVLSYVHKNLPSHDSPESIHTYCIEAIDMLRELEM